MKKNTAQKNIFSDTRIRLVIPHFGTASFYAGSLRAVCTRPQLTGRRAGRGARDSSFQKTSARGALEGTWADRRGRQASSESSERVADRTSRRIRCGYRARDSVVRGQPLQRPAPLLIGPRDRGSSESPHRRIALTLPITLPWVGVPPRRTPTRLLWGTEHTAYSQ